MKREDLNSQRLRKVAEYLELNLSATTKELEDKCGVAAARDYVRRLRDHGWPIETVELGKSESGARVVLYRLILEPPKPVQLTLL